MTRALLLTLLTLLLALPFAACDGDQEGNQNQDGDVSDFIETKEDTPQSLEFAKFSLVPAETCEDATQVWRDRAIANMEEAMAKKRHAYDLVDECYYHADASVQDSSWGGGEDSTQAPDDEAEDYSTTNNQEVGVDEADFIKNDGGHIYILADGAFQVVDAWPPEEATKRSVTAIEGIPRKMFVHEDKAVIYSSLGQDNYWTECTYGYDCDYTGDGLPLKITVLDLSDLDAPSLVREVYFRQGSLLTGRRIGDNVYTIVYHPDPAESNYQTVPSELQQYMYRCSDDPQPSYSVEEVDAMFEELRQENIAAINAKPIEDYLPEVEDVWYVDGQPQTRPAPFDCQNFLVSQGGDGESLISLFSFDLTQNQDLSQTSIVGRPGIVYAADQSIYLASSHDRFGRSMWYSELEEEEEASTIHKFVLDYASPQTAYVGSGLVKGRLLNQFSMGEHENHLRVATTTGWVPESHNTLSILHPDTSGELELVGQLDNIAPTEDIRSVRYNGEVGFMVTFKYIDPLFVFDLSDPTNPTILGELKIPGFSTYMHFLDEDHLLTIGFDTEDVGPNAATIEGIQLQILDVTDLTDPQLVHKEIIGTRGSASEAASNHLAFNYFSSRDLLALPMVVCEGGEDFYGDRMSFNGLMVYEVTAEDGFTYQGGIPHITPAEGYYNDSDCYSWWTDSSSTVVRSVFMEDYAYSVAPDVIKIAPVSDLSTPVAEIDLSSGL